jgi:hypothetical protein
VRHPKIWVTILVDPSDLEIRVEDDEELYATYYGVPCENLDYDAAWAFYDEVRKYEDE